MAYRQKGFPMHSVSALKMEKPGEKKRKETMRPTREEYPKRPDREEYLDTSNPTTSREIESIERAVRDDDDMRKLYEMELLERSKENKAGIFAGGRSAVQGEKDLPIIEKPPVEDKVVSSSEVETTQSTSGMPTFDISDLEGISGEKKSIAYGNIADTPRNQALIQKQQELNEWKNNNPDMSDEEFANWQKEMNKIRSQFTRN
tara:strand:+ start:238 stop:846 length:609 start_codon:yes stop_codon:yes gene_type:complete